MPFVFICRTSILVLSVFSFVLSAFAQNNIGIGTSTPAASAQLDVTSTTKGVLVPRVTSSQMNSIASPANGLLVYNTTASAFAYRTASGWVFLTGNATAANGWTTLGNAGTNSATNFIGTTDNQPVVIRQNNVRAGLLTDVSGTANTSWGFAALNASGTGTLNSAFGAQALYVITTGTGNTANGYRALFSNTEGSFNTAIGLDALFRNTEGHNNTANGVNALSFNTTGSNNTANGGNTLLYNTTGSNNTANGAFALYNNTTGFSNVAVGIRALFGNTTGSNLVAIGDSALYNNGLNATEVSHAVRNTAVGSKSLSANTIGAFNTATGNNALRSNSTGSSNTANGVSALFSNTSGNYNTANGENALFLNTTGGANTATGRGALFFNTTGGANTANGMEAGFNNQIGSGNVFIGYRAGYSETGSNKLYISNSDANSSNALLYGEFDNKMLTVNGKLNINGGNGESLTMLNGGDIRIYNDAGTANNLMYASGGSTGTTAVFTLLSDGKTFSFNGTGGSVSSDERLKQDIAPIGNSMEKLMKMNGYSYRFKSKAHLANKELGILAQEVKDVLPELVSTNPDGSFSVSYNGLIPVLINAVKEQQQTIVSQEERIAKLEAMIKTIMVKK